MCICVRIHLCIINVYICISACIYISICPVPRFVTAPIMSNPVPSCSLTHSQSPPKPRSFDLTFTPPL